MSLPKETRRVSVRERLERSKDSPQRAALLLYLFYLHQREGAIDLVRREVDLVPFLELIEHRRVGSQ